MARPVTFPRDGGARCGVLIDYARQRNAAKRGGVRQQLSRGEELAAPEPLPESRQAAQIR